MTYVVKKEIKTNCKQSVWDELIAEGKERIAAIERAIKLYSEKRDAGESWPGKPLRGLPDMRTL